MPKYLGRIKYIIATGTFKDTLILFSGNILSAFLGFIFVFFAVRFISKEEAGIFFAVTNLAVMVSSIADVGISTGIVNFISGAYASNDNKTAEEYMKAAFFIRLIAILVLGFGIILLSPIISPVLLATPDQSAGIWVGLMIISFFLWMFLPYILQAKKNFFAAVVLDNAYMIVRLVCLFVGVYFGGATLSKVFGSYVAAGICAGALGFAYVGFHFFKSRPDKTIYKKLINFSGWMGVSRITSSVSGTMDVQMMAALLGAYSTAIYSVPTKLASFIVVLGGSFSTVLATRLAGYSDKAKEIAYIKKSMFATFLIVLGIILWIIMARPFISFLFPKYLESIPVFRLLALANIPFILATPAVTAVIYSIKKPKYVGSFSIFQLLFMFLSDLMLIPRIGVIGPAVTLGVVNTIMMVYFWTITIKYYRSL